MAKIIKEYKENGIKITRYAPTKTKVVQIPRQNRTPVYGSKEPK